MEDLIRSLRLLSLHPPTPSQLTELLEPNKDSQKRLAQLLSLSTISTTNHGDSLEGHPDSDPGSESESEDDLTNNLMTQDLIVEGIQSLLENFNQSIEKEKQFYQKELQSFSKPTGLKIVPMKALLARQASDIRKTKLDRESCFFHLKGKNYKGKGKSKIGYQPKLILENGESYCSKKSIFDLKRIELEKGMKVPKRYEGNYFLFKVISELNHYVGISFVASDFNSNCIPISVSHFLPSSSINQINQDDEKRDLNDLLPIGTIVAIKEPLISLNHYTKSGQTQSKQIVGIRIDSPDDLIILSGETFYDDLGWKEIEFKGDAKEVGNENEGRNGIDFVENRWKQEGVLTRLAIAKQIRNQDQNSGIDLKWDLKNVFKNHNTKKVIFERINRFLKEKRIGSALREFLSAIKFGLLDYLSKNLKNQVLENPNEFNDWDSLRSKMNLENQSQLLSILQTFSLEVLILKSLENWNDLNQICQISLLLIQTLQNSNSIPNSSLQSNLKTLSIQFQKQFQISELLLKSSKTGPKSFQIQSFYSLSQTSFSPSMKSPHFVNEKLEVKDLTHVGKGRGLILLEDVEPGELLLCCKALGAAYPIEDEESSGIGRGEEIDLDLILGLDHDYENSNGGDEGQHVNGNANANANKNLTNGIKINEKENSNKTSSSKSSKRILETILRLNFDKNSMSRTSQVRAATNVIHALMDQPALRLPFLGLTAGPIPPSSFVSQPYPLRCDSSPSDLNSNLNLIIDRLKGKDGNESFIDSNYVEGVLSFNAFGPGIGPGRSEGLEKKSSSSTTKKEEGGKITNSNGKEDFTTKSVRPKNIAKSTSNSNLPIELTGEFARSTMPHPLPAIMNHSCLPNVSSVFMGDIVTTRSLHYLKKGTEIVHQYVRGEEPFLSRKSMTKKHGFDCLCPLCFLDNKDGAIERRKREEILMRELPTVIDRSRVVLKPRIKFDEANGNGDGNEKRKISSDLDEKEMEAHEEIKERLIHSIENIEKTYHKERGNLKPELFEIWHRAALHSEAMGQIEEAIEFELNSLRSANAIPISDEFPEDLIKDLPMRSGDLILVGGMKASNMMLNRLPDLHFDNALQSMLNISNLLLHKSPDLSSKWVSTAFWLHECVIAGGISVFLDRWADGVDLDLKKWSDLDLDGNGGLRGNGDGRGLLGGKWKDALENWLSLKG